MNRGSSGLGIATVGPAALVTGLIGQTQTVGTVTRSVGYGYVNGQRRSIVMPSGRQVTYGYDVAGRVTSVTIDGATLLGQVLYDPLGPVRGWTWGNGTVMSRTYDQDGKLTSYDSAGYVTYGHDDAFRITRRTDTATGGQAWTYGYDANDRLTSAVRSGLNRGWTYDANGNRLTQTGTNTATYTNSTTSNRLASIAGTPARTYGYDAAGNTTGYGAVTLTYQDDGRLRQAQNGTTVRTYVYNALGQRVAKRNGTSNTFYVYDEGGRLLGEYNNTGGLVSEYVWLGDIPVAAIRPRTGGVDVFYVHADHLNTPRKITRPSDNALRWRWDPDPFGTNSPNANPAGLGTFTYNLRFPGQYFDSETGLSYNYFRDYDPQVGRYVESDPIGLWGGLNTYSYAGANPVMLIDPEGTNPAAAARGGYAIGGIANAGLNAWLLRATGATLGGHIYEACNDSEDEKLRKRCQALKDSILKTCYGLQGRARMRCFEAANTSYRQCMGWE